MLSASIYPLITPESFFKDRFGQSNAYSDMNPSIFIEDDGTMTILVRKVNYRKFSNREFVLYQDRSISKYVIMRGKSLQSLETNEIVYNFSDFPRYGTWWEGFEDIRFIDKNRVLVTVPKCNPNGQPCIFLASLVHSTIALLARLSPHETEKNWMPFIQNYEVKVIYSVCPLVVKSLHVDDRNTIPVSCEHATLLRGYHGSTNGIEFAGGLLFLVHKYDSRSEHRWILLDEKKFTIDAISKPFAFLPHTYIEFPCSLVSVLDRFMISLGVNDNQAFIVSLHPSEIQWISWKKDIAESNVSDNEKHA
jgi:hypothetical protein